MVVTIHLTHSYNGFYNGLLVATLPLVILEAGLYWFIQSKNDQRDASLIHILLLMLALASLFLRDAMFFFHISSRSLLHPLRSFRRIDRVQYTLFGSLLIIAHIFFIRVLRKAFSRQPPANPTSPQNLI